MSVDWAIRHKLSWQYVVRRKISPRTKRQRKHFLFQAIVGIHSPAGITLYWNKENKIHVIVVHICAEIYRRFNVHIQNVSLPARGLTSHESCGKLSWCRGRLSASPQLPDGRDVEPGRIPESILIVCPVVVVWPAKHIYCFFFYRAGVVIGDFQEVDNIGENILLHQCRYQSYDQKLVPTLLLSTIYRMVTLLNYLWRAIFPSEAWQCHRKRKNLLFPRPFWK